MAPSRSATAPNAAKEALGPFPYPDFNPTDPDLAEFPGIADVLMDTDVLWTTWLEEMRALGEPPSGNEAWAALLDAIEDHRRINLEIDAAREAVPVLEPHRARFAGASLDRHDAVPVAGRNAVSAPCPARTTGLASQSSVGEEGRPT